MVGTINKPDSNRGATPFWEEWYTRSNTLTPNKKNSLLIFHHIKISLNDYIETNPEVNENQH